MSTVVDNAPARLLDFQKHFKACDQTSYTFGDALIYQRGVIPCTHGLAALFAYDQSLVILDPRLIDLWRAADDPTKQKAIRILSELV